ncbi:hypothetical protein [uncultured Gilvimarinus sp.]|uniref:hypothetical protein n=1 Tax=uncultured Gilvimarinus sp. TaxID=1689143 RepID=UPI0030EF8F10|tara:strand:- start:4002 stop:4856 length:855 start_codon:yes stop_codon:yes gene_type:complete
MENKEIVFDLYRFQLLPLTRTPQPDFYRNELPVEELKRRKNELFDEVLRNLPDLHHRTLSVRHKVIFKKGDWLVFKFGAQKSVEREDEDFQIEHIDSWPHVTVIINNDPDVQIVAISRNIRAFSESQAVANLLEKNFMKHLEALQLTLSIEGIFDKQNFWDIVNKYQGKLTSIKFELISPNMANISKALKVDLRQINAETNSHKTNLELNSAEGAVLEVSRENEIVDSLVEYASEGGGDISIKIKGLSKKIHTQKTTRTIELDELTVESLNETSLEILLQSLKP